MDTMSSDACLVCMLNKGEYGVHTSSSGQTLFLPFFACVFAVAGYHGISYAWGGVKHQAIQRCGGIVWFVYARILPIVAKTPNCFLSCARCAHAVRALCTHAPQEGPSARGACSAFLHEVRLQQGLLL